MGQRGRHGSPTLLFAWKCGLLSHKLSQKIQGCLDIKEMVNWLYSIPVMQPKPSGTTHFKLKELTKIFVMVTSLSLAFSVLQKEMSFVVRMFLWWNLPLTAKEWICHFGRKLSQLCSIRSSCERHPETCCWARTMFDPGSTVVLEETNSKSEKTFKSLLCTLMFAASVC